MKEYLKYNLHCYLTFNKLKNWLFILVNLLILIIILLSFKIDTYESTLINSETVCETNCSLNFYLPIKTNFDYKSVLINNKEYEIINYQLTDTMLNVDNEAFQKYTLNLKEYEGKDKKIVELKLVKNKEKLIQKILKIIVERS